MKSRRLSILIFFLIQIIYLPISFHQACAQKECKFVLIENRNKGDNDYVTKAQKEFLSKGGYEVVTNIKDLSDMESKFMTKFEGGDCDCVKELYIVGHGDSGIISVGTGVRKLKSNRYINGNKSQWEGPLGSMMYKFCPGLPHFLPVKVFLIGCKTGGCNPGRDKLFELAKFLEAEVTAPVDKLKGNEIFDYLSNHKDRLQTSNPYFKPDHIAPDKKSKASARKPIVFSGFLPLPESVAQRTPNAMSEVLR